MLTTIFSQITTCSLCRGWGYDCNDCRGRGVYLDKNNQRLIFGLPAFFAFKKRLLLSRIKKMLILSILTIILILIIQAGT